MLKTNTDAFLDWMSAMEDIPDVTNGYGLTKDDIRKMDDDPQKYIPLATYLLALEERSVPYNDDAMSEEELQEELNAFIKRHVTLAD